MTICRVTTLNTVSSEEGDEESQKMKDNDKAMETLRVGKDNPFGKLRYNAKKAVIEMYNITSDEVQLPRLEAWLEKKQFGVVLWTVDSH